MVKRFSEEWKLATRAVRSNAIKNSYYHTHISKKPIETLSSWPNIRIRIFNERSRKCERCGWAEKNSFNGSVPVQINHIDGNRKNNHPSNLEVLCPNCHSLTEQFMFYGKKHKKHVFVAHQ